MRGLIHSAPLVLIEFGQKDCGPCRALRSRIEAWQKQHPGTAYYYLELEEHRQQASQLGIFAAPTLLLYVEGRPALRESGCFSLQDFLYKVQRYESFLR